MTHGRAVLLAGLLLIGGCGYFNSLYNANRSFATAERASRSGDRATALREYRSAIDRAAVSYRKYPDGRWADDALLLLGRARFALGEYELAAGAMQRLLAQSRDDAMRPVAHAYLGAALVALDSAEQAVAHLDTAAAALAARTDDGAFTRLWRARAAFHAGRTDAGWSDLGAAMTNRHIAYDAALEGVRHARQHRDSARAVEFMQHLAHTTPDAGGVAAIDSLLRAIGSDWSATIAFNGSAPLADADWPPDMRDALRLTRASLAVQAGRPDDALELAMQVGNAVNLGVGSRARLLAAQIRLAHAERVDELEDIRAVLLPAYDDRAALDLMRRVRAAQILLVNGRDPAASLSLFAAAELLRDELAAPRLARAIFLEFATTQSVSVWAGKAALAAHQIGPTAETAAALEALRDNAYVSAARGGTYAAADIDRAEERLAFGISGLRAEALADAIRRDAVVGRALTVLDSTRMAARNDSVRIACGVLIDSLSVSGIRADSTRTACLRGDTARVRFVLGADTVLLRDTTGAGDPRPLRRDTTARPDTTQQPRAAVTPRAPARHRHEAASRHTVMSRTLVASDLVRR
ncbi:MAG TPA: hypothetical protein VK912_18680 [Longimicrobiales bacterium]|nr:hypothetical protein [Longimicrobiales bacterium]